MKACSKCGEVKPLDEFPKSKGPRKGVVACAACKVCARVQQDLWRHANKAHVNKCQTARNVGLTLDEYDALDLSRCEVCARELSLEASKSNKPHLDHDHETGKFRGVLCGMCNVGLGHAQDSVDVLLQMIRYLKDHGK